MPESLLLHKNFLKLSNSSRTLYIHMRLEGIDSLEFEFPVSRALTFISKHTFLKTKEELVERGFIEIIHCDKNSGVPNVYKLCNKWNTFERGCLKRLDK